MTRYVDNSAEEEAMVAHESFGMISVNRRQGQVDQLFGVDYPQGHSIAITISEASLRHSHGHESYFPGKEVVQIEMSEVQYARMISNPNSTGTPCTLRRRQTGEMVGLEYPPAHMFDADKAKGNINDVARKIGGNLDHVLERLNAHADGKMPTKTELRELIGWLQQARQGITSDLGFYVAQAEEKIDTAVTNGKTEFDAYVQNSLAELGRETVRARLAAGDTAPLSLSAPTMPSQD